MCLHSRIWNGPLDRIIQDLRVGPLTRSNDRLDAIMCHRGISIGGVNLDVGEEKGCSWTKVGLPTKYAQDVLGETGVFFLTVIFE